MLVQQEKINFFYKELKKSLDLSAFKISPHRKNQEFLRKRPLKDNLSVNYWMDVISQRMALDVCSFSNESPFHSYEVNSCWLRLAFDISKIISSSSKEYRLNWLKILFPKLFFKKSRDIDLCLDPILGTPYFHSGSFRVYVVNKLPKFVKAQDLMAKNNDPGIKRVLHDYFLDFNESYFYVLSTRKFYFLYSNGEVEDVSIIYDDQFHEALLALLDENRILFQNHEEIDNRNLVRNYRYTNVPKGVLEELIVRCGGYPNLDLRGFYISDNMDKLFSINSLISDRSLRLEKITASMIFKLTSEKFGSNYTNFRDFQDILPHVIFEDKSYSRIRPLSLAEFARARRKDDYKPYTDGNTTFVLVRRAITNFFAEKWMKMQIPISRVLLVELLPILRSFYDSNRESDFIACKESLNNWSKSTLGNNHGEIYSKYRHDFKKLLNPKQYEMLLNTIGADQNRIFWLPDSIREIYKFYSLSIEIEIDGKQFYYHVFDLLMNIILSFDNSIVFPDLSAISLYCLSQCPDKLKLFADLREYKSKTQKIASYSILLKKFEDLLNYCSEDNKLEIANIIVFLKSSDFAGALSSNIVRKISKIFRTYDEEVKFSINDHTRPATPMSSRWIYLAKLLTGMGYFQNYLELLCPQLMSYVDIVSGKHLSDMDLRSFVFTHDRKRLINLSYSYNVYKLLGLGFDCNGDKLRYLYHTEVNQIANAAHKFKGYYKDLSAKKLNEPSFNYRIILALHRFIKTTYSLKKIENNRYLFYVNDHSTQYLQSLERTINFIIGTISITITDITDGISCVINFSNAYRDDICCRISNTEFSQSLERPITKENFMPHQLELLYLLRQKKYLYSDYNYEVDDIIELEYNILSSFYNNLPLNEKQILDSTVISLYNQKIYFKEAIIMSKYDAALTNNYFIRFIQELLPEANYGSYSSYRSPMQFGSNITTPRRKDFKDPSLEIDQIFVSFMTHYFVPEHSSPRVFRYYGFYDSLIIFPEHQVLIWLIESFGSYYAKSCIADDIDHKYKYLLDNFPKCFYSQMEKFSPNYGLFGFLKEVSDWIRNILTGKLFNFLPLFETEEIAEIIYSLQETEELFPYNLLANFNNFKDETRPILSFSGAIQRSSMNIKLIRFLFSLTRYHIELVSDVESVYKKPYTIYLSQDGFYQVLNVEGDINSGNINPSCVDLICLETRINDLNLKNRVLVYIAREGHISLDENDFPIIFEIIYKHKKLNVHAKNLLRLFLVAQGIEVARDSEIKANIINFFKLSFNEQGNRNNSIFTNGPDKISYNQIFNALVKKANSANLMENLKSSMSHRAGAIMIDD